jgi:hypothetical protein
LLEVQLLFGSIWEDYPDVFHWSCLDVRKSQVKLILADLSTSCLTRHRATELYDYTGSIGRNGCFLCGEIDVSSSVVYWMTILTYFYLERSSSFLDVRKCLVKSILAERENAIYLRTAEALGVSLEKSHCWASRSASDQALGESQVAG